jgi:hypothetical protein
VPSTSNLPHRWQESPHVAQPCPLHPARRRRAAGSILAAPAGASDTPSPSARAVTTLTGFSVSNYPPETYAAALARQSATMGTPEVIRYFYGSSPLRWPPSSGFTGTKPVVVSFNRPPVSVNKGLHDAEIRAFLAAMPRDRITWVSYEHEMDAKVKKGHYAAADVRAAYVRFANLVTASGNPMIKKTLILTGWDYRNRMLTYYPGAAYVDTLAVDKYRWGTETIPYLFDEAFSVAAAYGKPLGVAEFGVWSGTDAERAAYLDAAARYTAGKVQFLTYFNVNKAHIAGDHNWEIWRLPLSSTAWKNATLR